MFGLSSKKKNNENHDKNQLKNLTVYTIPKEFYAGKDPVIDLEKEEMTKERKPSKPIKISRDVPITSIQVQTKIKPGRKNFSHASILLSTRILAITTAVLFVVFVVGIAQYYWEMLNSQQYRKGKNPNNISTTSTAPTTTVVVVAPTTTVETVTTTTSTIPETVPTTTPALTGGVIEFPSILLGDSADLDGDKLTDAEEDLFSTDPGKADTDGDGYEDFIEIFNLYSPNGFAPTRLLGSGAVSEFTNPVYGYKIYYPSSWIAGNVDPQYKDVLFSTITGENVEVRVFDKVNGQSFEDWFTQWAKGEELGQLKDFKTVFKENGKSRSDNLVFYLEDDKYHYVIVYHITGSGAVNYRKVITMMARSFRTSQNKDALLPEQQVIRPKPPAAATTQ